MRAKRRPRTTLPTIFVFCEGKTEQAYIDMLRSHFRVPIQIETKILNTKISRRLIDNYLKAKGNPDVDRIYLFYDGDRQDTVERLKSIDNAELMLSCPCVELWYLLHYTDHTAALSADNAVKSLLRHAPTYRKGYIHTELKDALLTNHTDAAARARRLTPMANPSSTAYVLVEYLKSRKKG